MRSDRLASAGLAVVAIDGPHHGDRVPAPMTASAYQRMTADWLDAVSVLAGLGRADDGHVSVFGMSMGARFGLSAALGPRLQCAVLGKFCVRPRRAAPPRAAGPRAHRGRRARRLRPGALPRAVGRQDLPRDGQFELFDALASADKRLPQAGPREQTHPDDEASTGRLPRAQYITRLISYSAAGYAFVSATRVPRASSVAARRPLGRQRADL